MPEMPDTPVAHISLNVPAALWERFSQGCRARQRAVDAVLPLLIERTVHLWEAQDALVQELQTRWRPTSSREEEFLRFPF